MSLGLCNAKVVNTVDITTILLKKLHILQNSQFGPNIKILREIGALQSLSESVVDCDLIGIIYQEVFEKKIYTFMMSSGKYLIMLQFLFCRYEKNAIFYNWVITIIDSTL